MIYYVNNKIYDWNFEGDNIVKVYRDGVVCYYKMVAGEQEPCYAVTDDIEQYSSTEFVDVFDLATEKWYKLNNLNDYEEYGVYGSGRTITYYEGKLTIDDGYEYEYSGSSWVNVGAVSGGTVTIMSPEYLEKDASHKGGVDLLEKMAPNMRFQMKLYPTYANGGLMLADDNDIRLFWNGSSFYYDFLGNRQYKSGLPVNNMYEWEFGDYYTKDITASTNNIIDGSYTVSYTRPYTMCVFARWDSDTGSIRYAASDLGRLYWLKIYSGDTLVRDFIPMVSGGSYGLFDKVSKVASMEAGTLTASTAITEVVISDDTTYPVYYSDKQDPPQNLVFTDMAEAEAYRCPYVGLKATIGGEKYIFNANYEWEKYGLPSGYTEVEYVQSTGRSSVNLGVHINSGLNDTYTIVFDNEMTYESGFGELQTFLACQNEQNFHGWSYRFDWSGAFDFSRSSMGAVDVVRTNISANTYHNVMTCVGVDSLLQSNNPIALFSGLDPNLEPFRFVKGKLYNMQITLNDVVIADFVPAKRNNDDVYGVYDKISNVFYTTTTEVPLTGGNEVG